MRYLSLSNVAAVELCEYPDSNKIGMFADTPGAPVVRALHRASSTVDYYDGESTEQP